jgi:cytochrome c biogenesis protein CcdA/thiol-disulfide isomerase/thioredoxin
MLLVHSDSILAFIEGVSLIVSPCILPILPFILAASVVGSRLRPFLITLGFVLSFIFFALLSRKIFAVSGIPQDTLQTIAYGFLLLLGLVMVVPYLENRFALLTSKLASSAENATQGKRSEGIMGALFVGLLIGIVWTPCAGPILAAALIQVISAKTNVDAVIIIIAFSIGTAIPMLLIALFSQQLTRRIHALAKHATLIRRAMGIIIIAFALFGLSGFNLTAWLVTPAHAEELQDGPYVKAPEISGITKWFNTQPLRPSELKGKVVLVDFWAYSCINCIRTLPHIESWYKKYKDQGLVVIGVHAPEFPFEMDPKNVAAAVKEFGITYPVAMDNDYVTWSNFSNRYWPAHYLIDREGRLVYTHFGEGDYAETENKIRELLHLNKSTDLPSDSATTSLSQTPETYLGYERAKNFSSPESVTKDKLNVYSFPGNLARNQWALKGPWTIQKDHIVAGHAGAGLMFYFTATKVYLVLGNNTGHPVNITLKLNGNTATKITVSQHKLYELINQSSAKNGVLEITAEKPGLEAYAFTFGN